MTTYHFIRHGESEANEIRAHLICGRSSETPLTQKGIHQARLLGHWCTNQQLQFDHVFPSKAVRAMQTAQYLCEAMHIALENVIPLDDMEEKDQGDWTGVLRSSIYTPGKLKEMNDSDGHFAPPGGESDRQAAGRMYKAFIQHIVPATQGAKHVAIVSHGNVIRSLVKYHLNYPVSWADGLKNTAVTSIIKAPETEDFRVLIYNQTDHYA